MMKSYLITAAFVIFCFVIVSHSFPIEDKGATQFLQKFGYLDKNDGQRIGAILGPDEISNAIKDFQRFVGLEETGELDSKTLSKMNAPRCGVKDIIDHSRSPRRKRYAVQGSRWAIRHLTYRISKYSSKMYDRRKIDSEIARAFKVWSDKSTLTFEERKTGPVNIDIRFETAKHGDEDAFDGPGKTLAHAFFPRYGGATHFDDDEKWTFEERTGINLFQVAAHEFGHSLGLLHSEDTRALMKPYYSEYDASFKLHWDDIEGIQSLYGSRNEPSAPDLCRDPKIDTITRTQMGNTYVFKGDFYWKTLSDGGIADGYPRRISDNWHGLEGNLDASITWSNGKTYFLKGGRYWRSTDEKMDDGYPKLLSVGFEGIPEMVDAAFIWSGNGKPYFFKGDQYWRYDDNIDPPVSDYFPRPISSWNGLPDNIDAAFQWENNHTYFFKDGNYYRYNDKKSEVDSGYPLSTAELWFGCKTASNS